jgi:hypothetical protein
MIALVCCWGCAGAHSAYAPPAQISMPSGPEPPYSAETGDGLTFSMSDPDADDHIVRDVKPKEINSEWRLTGLHPQFRLQPRTREKLDFYLRFFQHEEALRERGPVRLTIRINGHEFKPDKFILPGDLEFRWPIPDSWIKGAGPVDISMDVDPAWQWHNPEASMGVLLHTIGFERRPE